MRILPLVLVAAVATTAAAQQRPARDTSDNFRWLESMTGDSAMAWVRAENAKTLNVLEKDPRFPRLFDQALAVAQANDRIPFANFSGGTLYNFWRDSAHVRGIWRRTTLASYRTANPKWETVLDLDSLAAAEKANWVWKGGNCAEPRERRCLLELSDGGEDAVTAREFDLGTRTFVANGFTLPRAKMSVAWQGEDTLIVATEWKPGELTQSGYAYIVKRVVRGQPLGEAKEIFRGNPKDVAVWIGSVTDASGHRLVFLNHATSFFETEKLFVRPNDVVKSSIPLKAGIDGMVDGQVLVQLSEDWKSASSPSLAAGSLVSFDVAAALRDPAGIVPTTVFAPGPRESIGGTVETKDRIVIGTYRNVNGRVLVATRGAKGKWTTAPLDLPNGVSSNVVSADRTGNSAFVSVAGFLTPSSAWLVDAKTMRATKMKSIAPKFDASRDVVEQLEAASTDGTKIPYFVVHPKGMKLDGNNPTILNAYGGFEVSETPFYSGSLGKLWLEQGGVFVLANIRGGGEFGPAWHEAGLKTKRQIIYDDFAAVARDLVTRKITTPRHLGIEGGSNGGLLMGVEYTQHPELWNAVDIQVPLLDMLRFEQIQAGASWVGEYGSASIPNERAFLSSISPYHNIRPGTSYPEALIWTTTKDDRVGPQHARKFAAKLSANGIPYYFYEVIEGGHGSGANLRESAHTMALEYTYFSRKLMDGGRVVP